MAKEKKGSKKPLPACPMHMHWANPRSRPWQLQALILKGTTDFEDEIDTTARSHMIRSSLQGN